MAIVGAFVTVASACSNQGEGERCESLNGNADCKTDEGLICYPQAQLRNTNSDRCCPADRSTAVHPVCKTSIDVGGGDASPPPDTGPPPDGDSGSPELDASLEDASLEDASLEDAGSDADAAGP